MIGYVTMTFINKGINNKAKTQVDRDKLTNGNLNMNKERIWVQTPFRIKANLFGKLDNGERIHVLNISPVCMPV